MTTLLAEGLTPEDICRRALKEFDLDVLDEASPVYKCYCTRARVEAALISTGRAELLDMAKQDETRVSCQFCDKQYIFTPDDLAALAQRASKA